MRWLTYLCFSLLVLLLGFSLKSWSSLYQELNIHATQTTTTSRQAIYAKTEYLENSNHQKIGFWYFPVNKPKAVIVLVHGYSNPGGKNQMMGHVEYLNHAGYSALAVDLRSFGSSDGDQIFLGTKEWQDLETVYDYLFSLPENQNVKIGYLGFSMGATTAINSVAKTGKGDFIIASVPYASVESLYKFRLNQNNSLSFLPIKIAILAKFGLSSPKTSPQALISKIYVPITIFSAQNDTYINHKDAQLLYNLANEPKEFWQTETNHDIFSALPEDFQQHVLSFLDKI